MVKAGHFTSKPSPGLSRPEARVRAGRRRTAIGLRLASSSDGGWCGVTVTPAGGQGIAGAAGG
jgi:hypothetical protein